MPSLSLQNHIIEYELKKSPRSKRIRITIGKNHLVMVTVPRWAPLKAGEEFLLSKADWIIKALNTTKKAAIQLPKVEQWQDYKQTALDIIEFIIRKYEPMYPYRYKSIAIKNQSGRWGSCSNKGNLNFNYRIQFLPMELAEYIVVHELCHLKQMNHSSCFWALVAKTFPNYQELRKQLRSIHY